MDETDLKLIKLLWESPRASYRDLADALDISTPAVHRRIQAAREAEIILGPFAKLSPKFVGAVRILVFGRSEASSLDDVMKEMRKGDCTNQVTMMTGNVLLMHGLLREIGDLDRHIRFVRKAAMMPEPTLGILSHEDKEFAEPDRAIRLTKLDFKIMHSLHGDGRRSINDIADHIHVSPKTVRNHLNRMVDGKILVFEVIANQAQSGNFVPMLQVNLEKGAEKKEVMINLNRKHIPPLVYSTDFSNHLDMFLSFGWLQNMAQLRHLVSGIEAEEGVASVVPHVFVHSHTLETWLDKLLEDPITAMSYCSERKLI